MSELMCSQSKCRRKDEHIAELEAELETAKDERAIVDKALHGRRVELAELREAVRSFLDVHDACSTETLIALLQGEGDE